MMAHVLAAHCCPVLGLGFLVCEIGQQHLPQWGAVTMRSESVREPSGWS